MKHSKLLLPHAFKPVGIVLFIISTILLIGYGFFDFQFSWNDIRQFFGLDRLEDTVSTLGSFSVEADLCYSVAGILAVLGGMMIGFSRCKNEDEFIEQIRYETLIITMYISGIAIVLILIFAWGLHFLVAASAFIYFSIVFFLIYFHVKVALLQRKGSYEE